MKTVRIYIVFLIKIFATIAFMGAPLGVIDIEKLQPFSNVALLYSAALAYDPNYVMYAAAINVAVSIILILSLLTALIGVVSRGARKISVFLIALSALVDFVFSFFVGDTTLRTSCIVVTAIMLIICLIPFKKHK